MLRCQRNIYSLFVLFALTNAFDINRLEEPTVDNSLRSGNGMFFGSEFGVNVSQAAADNAADDALNLNEIPVRYDEAQLWRVYNISEQMPLAELLENKYDGIIWKANPKYLDISINKKNLKAARNYLNKHNIAKEVLHPNIQELFDAVELEGVKATQTETGRRSKKQARSAIHWDDYHDLDTIYAFMREIRRNYADICSLYSIGKTAEGRDLKVLRISENPREYKKIWIDGGIHAREWISPATVTYIMHKLMSNWTNQPDHIKQRTWYFMPVMNPDGYVYSRNVNRLWRKNRSPSPFTNCVGVDLNRNFNINWNGRGSSTNPCSDTYRGQSAASELETKAVANFLTKRKHNLEAYLTYHSYGQFVVYPWAYKAAKAKDAARLQHVGNRAVQAIYKRTGSIYRSDVTHALLGIAGGGSDDWAKAACGAKYVYTIELRDNGKYGFQLPPSQIRDTAEEGMCIVEAVAQAIV